MRLSLLLKIACSLLKVACLLICAAAEGSRHAGGHHQPLPGQAKGAQSHDMARQVGTLIYCGSTVAALCGGPHVAISPAMLRSSNTEVA